ncbi:MAG: SLC13/DASS family transporter [Cyclobacteriaceae bacterium]|nr:SLC13/DASS family transporter [Cyclobacteriaceae bacterium HetDA_MAG_MS6]
MNQGTKIAIGLGLPALILVIPTDIFPLEGITVVEQRVVSIFLLAALFWILEPIPIYATSLLIIFLELVMVSNKGLNVLIKDENMGTLLSYKDIMYTFASPIIILFLGGFFLAMAATKFRLDQNLARVLLRPFGTNPRWVMLGLMLITAVFSMFMSNTATTAMMLSILTPVLASFRDGDPGKLAFTLAIPVAANVGGIGTPIGTPPNAVALKYLTGDYMVSFGEWMGFAVPFVVILLLIGWFVLMSFYKIATPAIQLEVKGSFLKNRKAYIVYVTFILTILLWLTDFIHGMNAYIVAMIPVAVFSSFGIITRQDLKNISWDVLWLVSGGIALGYALDSSGLASRLINAIPFASLSPIIVVLAVSLVAALMANFMSNTATANLLLPLIAVLGTSISSLSDIGGGMMVILCTTIACSMGMALPISTPPNALAFGTGLLTTKDMARPGILIAVIGLLLTYGLMIIMNAIGFF